MQCGALYAGMGGSLLGLLVSGFMLSVVGYRSNVNDEGDEYGEIYLVTARYYSD